MIDSKATCGGAIGRTVIGENRNEPYGDGHSGERGRWTCAAAAKASVGNEGETAWCSKVDESAEKRGIVNEKESIGRNQLFGFHSVTSLTNRSCQAESLIKKGKKSITRSRIFKSDRGGTNSFRRRRVQFYGHESRRCSTEARYKSSAWLIYCFYGSTFSRQGRIDSKTSKSSISSNR